jgi:PhnB protein
MAVPYLCVHDAAAALDFYARAFGAAETARWVGPDGRVGHAELDVEGAVLFLADEHPEIGVLSPTTLGGTAVSIVLEVADVDAFFARAAAEGATVEREPADQGSGGRSGWLVDPFGHRWNVATTTERLSKDELRERVSGEYDVR